MLLDLARLFVGLGVLTFASYTDWRWRRAPNALWLVMAGLGLAILLVEAAVDLGAVEAAWPYLVVAPLFALLIYAFWWVGLLAGGADAKALMALAVLLPFPVHVVGGALPWLGSPLPGSAVVLEDSLVGVLLLPVGFLLRNLVRWDLRFPAMFLGYPMAVEDVADAWVWPMEAPDEGTGELRFHLMPSRRPELTDEDLDALREAGVERLWVTPKVPYMIPLLVGLVLAFTVGDLLYAAVGLALG